MRPSARPARFTTPSRNQSSLALGSVPVKEKAGKIREKGGSAGRSGSAATPRGRLTSRVVPCPGSLYSRTCPWCSSRMRLTRSPPPVWPWRSALGGTHHGAGLPRVKAQSENVWESGRIRWELPGVAGRPRRPHQCGLFINSLKHSHPRPSHRGRGAHSWTPLPKAGEGQGEGAVRTCESTSRIPRGDGRLPMTNRTHRTARRA